LIPPDTMGDVGPSQILVHVNGRIKVFSKSGVVGGLNASDLSFWSSVRDSQSVTNPHVRYDRLSGRWFVAAVNVAFPNRVLIAVSSGPTITSASSFTFFQFQQDLPSPPGDTGRYADSPSLGVDRNALYIGANIVTVTGAYQNSSVWVVNKADLISGTLTVTAFRNVTG